jgi:hypothetical protein
MMADEHDGPPTIVGYRVCWRSPDYPDGMNGWETSVLDWDDRAAAEAACERMSRDHAARWPDRRDYAVVSVERRAVRVFPAPAKGEG